MRIRKAKEQEIQAGALKLLRLMPEVAWAYKVPVGEYVILRPLNGASVRQQLQPAVNLGIIKASQIGYIEGAPEGVLDIALQLAGNGKHCELEVKRQGEAPTGPQLDRIDLIRKHGGCADWIYDIDQVQGLIRLWAK